MRALPTNGHLIACASAALSAALAAATPPPRSPLEVAFSPDGSRVAASDATADALVAIDAATGRIVREVGGLAEPCGVAWSSDGARIYVAERRAGTVAEVETSSGAVRRLGVGHRPAGIALAPGRGLLLVANSGEDSVSILELASWKEAARVRVGREPFAVAVAPGEEVALVGERLPEGPATSPDASAGVSWVELEGVPSSARLALRTRLPPNSMNVHGVAFSPGGLRAFVAHNLGRTNMSTERVSNGWISRNALTILDVPARRRVATVPLDRAGDGAANPWGVAISPSGKELWVALSGVHELGRLDLDSFFDALAIGAPSASAYGDAATHDLGVFTEGRFLRAPLPGRGPRGLAASPDGRLVAVALYFSGKIAFVDAKARAVVREAALGASGEPDLARRGEEIFHDAGRSYERWLSCATCHPEGRADGLNWDLFNDGSGNPKNTRSLLFAHATPPAMSRGVRLDAEAAIRAGFESILFRAAPRGDIEAVAAYIRSLERSPGPRVRGGRLSDRAERGKALFEGPGVGCASCHPAPLFTDLRSHDVGTRGVLPWEDRFDTPSLIELWRTAPYLHDGRAATLSEVVGALNAGDLHGRTSHLSEEDLEALVEYLESL